MHGSAIGSSGPDSTTARHEGVAGGWMWDEPLHRRNRRRQLTAGATVAQMRLPIHAALIALGTLAAAAPDRVVAGAFTITPPPAWVEPIRADLERPPRSGAEGGVDYLVVDDQLRVGPGERQAYRHLVTRVVSTKGIEDGSDVRVDFDPQYQRLVLHAVTIHRGTSRIPALHPGEVKIIQRERELDRRLYDGRLTAVIFLRDVRVGDVVESSYTLVGSNPIFGGRFADGFDLGYGVPVERLGVRILLPNGRPLAWRTHGLDLPPAVGKSGGGVEYRWSRGQVDSFHDEGDLPAGLRPYPWLEVSEWGEWADVVRWALPLYAPGEPAAGMAERIAAWRQLPDEAARGTAALRFVQDEVRYLGIELGPSSHRPHRPAEVFERRFGDCKAFAGVLSGRLERPREDHNMEDAGQKLKRARERLNLRYRDVEEASLRIAEKRGNGEFGIALSRLADIENKGTV